MTSPSPHPGQRWTILAVLGTAQLMVVLDATVVNVALPSAQKALHPSVLAIGDMIRIRQADGSSIALPGLAPVAMQEGRHAARVLRDRLHGRPGRPFRYHDRGNLATIGRARAVADIKHVRVSGLLAWLIWLAVHLCYLIGFENRLVVLTRWAFGFIAHERGARLIIDTAQTPTPDVPAAVALVPSEHQRPDARRDQAA
ncbi:MAG TPA: hypothetical protein VJ741_17440 [Solirubrobacteraceae bacterium]|nr:hypothetical protein [Solirubrobacteraceae bacterium]